MEIFPSLISADILNLEKTIKNLDSHCQGYHIDVMDDHFVPNLTWGPAFVNAIAEKTELPLHVHLMVTNPERWVDRLKLRKIDLLIFHLESFSSATKIDNMIRDVKAKGWLVGIAIKPKTDVKLVFNYIKNIDHVLIMSVEPGFSGQAFIPGVISKVENLIKKRDEIEKNLLLERQRMVEALLDKDRYLKLPFKIGMDGGIDSNNIKILSEAGVDQFGIASAIFSQKDYLKALENLYII